jgi:hypothetical protein
MSNRNLRRMFIHDLHYVVSMVLYLSLINGGKMRKIEVRSLDFSRSGIIPGSTGFCGSASGRNVCYEIIQEFSSFGMTEMSSKAFPEPLPRSFLIHKYLRIHDHKIR